LRAKEYPPESKAIYETLMKIHDKWRSAMEVEKEIKDSEKEKLDETVIISPKTLLEKSTPPVPKSIGTEQNKINKEKKLDETVIISPAGPHIVPTIPPLMKKNSKKEKLDETVIISPKKPLEKSTLTGSKDDEKGIKEDTFFTKTVIITPDSIKDKEK